MPSFAEHPLSFAALFNQALNCFQGNVEVKWILVSSKKHSESSNQTNLRVILMGVTNVWSRCMGPHDFMTPKKLGFCLRARENMDGHRRPKFLGPVNFGQVYHGY